MARRRRDADGPPMEFDGTMYWYVRWFDESDDRCCVCREPIPEDDVPLILFKERGRETLMARLHFSCGAPFLRVLLKHQP